MGFLKKIFGSHSDHELKRLYPIADKIEAMSDEYAALTDEQLRAKTDEFKQRYADGDEKFAPLPDVFLIDGGMTHAAVAEKVCAAFGLHIPIFGMVKDDRHRTRALTTAEGHEIDLHADPAVFALIGQIQEETHRFAIEYQRSLRNESFGSELSAIPGVGSVRKNELLRHFKTLKAIKNAGLDELSAVVPKNTAKAVFEYYHKSEEKT